MVPAPTNRSGGFIGYLEKKGFSYDPERKWWSRTWTTNKKKDFCTEVYQTTIPSEWHHIMMSNDGRIFFEEKNLKTNELPDA
tara:strand:+ start:1299 stop:1544 length:246 start_codon:yes stop_codon:yes gene_type:complete